jgi:hypothetical protein
LVVFRHFDIGRLATRCSKDCRHRLPVTASGLPTRVADSQEDSQGSERLRTNADDRGIQSLTPELQRRLVDGSGHEPRGLQNRLRGAAEASWVGSIPIHPRQISRF